MHCQGMQAVGCQDGRCLLGMLLESPWPSATARYYNVEDLRMITSVREGVHAFSVAAIGPQFSDAVLDEHAHDV